jgi:FkbH-like protein
MDCLDALLACENQPAPSLRESVARILKIVRLARQEEEMLRRLAHRSDAAACWLQATVLEERGFAQDAAACYAKVVDPAGREVPDTLIQRARIAARVGDKSTAATLLRFALRLQSPYSLLLRSESLTEKLSADCPPKRRARVALLSSSTTSLIKAVLSSLCFRDSIAATFYEAPFATFQQSILDTDSELYRFAPDFVILLLNYRDAMAGAPYFTALWEQLLNHCSCQIIQPTFYLSPEDPDLLLASSLPKGRSRTLREINAALFQAASPSVTLLDTDRMAAQHIGHWEDKLKWSSARLYPAPAALPILAEHVVSSIRSALGLSAKLLALDLDNTLWGGIIGEDGIGGIKLGPPSAIGERYQDFQRYLKALQARGILLAAVSKNNPADGDSVFRHHDSMILRREDFVAFEANWQPKPDNLLGIAQRLGLGLDSMVFLDDNPAERATMRNSLPDVIVPEITTEPSDSITALEHGLYFQALTVTKEDNLRHAVYVVRNEAPANLADYLCSLEMQVDCVAVDESNIERVTQLVNKTNQFNLTSRRYTHQQVLAFSNSPDHWLRCFRLRDRFADHGLIAVLLAEIQLDETWRIDLWLMSCRVIGRGVEDQMFSALRGSAATQAARQITGCYIPTAKNELVKDLLPKFGFEPGTSEGEFRLQVA